MADEAKRIARRVALVTDGCGDAGRGIAAALAESGFDVALAGPHDAADLAGMVRDLQRRGVAALHCGGDVADAADRAAMVEAVRDRFGRLDVLVNNSSDAADGRADILDTTEESFDRFLRTSLKGPYFLTQLVARWMIEQRKADAAFAGVIINVGPASANQPPAARGEYGIGRAGIAMATQLWAVRLAELGIAVYEVRPGLVETDMTVSVKDEQVRLLVEGLTVENRWGAPEDVGRAVAVLARGELSCATGNVLNIDGGLTLRRL